MIIAIGSDHAGFELKSKLITYLEKNNYQVIDCGTKDTQSANYAINGIKVAEQVAMKNAQLGIVICGSGIGISISANKVRGIRAALVNDAKLAKLAREHNDANILALGARFITEEMAYASVDAFLNTPFEGGRHEKRIDTIYDYEMCCHGCD